MIWCWMMLTTDKQDVKMKTTQVTWVCGKSRKGLKKEMEKEQVPVLTVIWDSGDSLESGAYGIAYGGLLRLQ